MLKNKKLRLILFSTLLVILLLRETGYVNLNFFKSSIKAQINASWNISSTKIDSFETFNKRWKEKVNDSCNFCGELKNFPVSVSYKSHRGGDKSDCDHIDITITEFSPGLIWTPLFKSANFTATASCSNSVRLYKEANGTVSFKAVNIHGQLSATGHITVYGFSSYRNTKKLIIDYVEKEFYQSAKNYLSAQ